MDLSDWLDSGRGRLAEMAAHFRVTQSAVCQWRTNGVPPARMKAVRDFTGGEVTLEDMLPPANEQQEIARAAA
jgi:DNA-binding transcriptional regulator YdaS (Cro superfamily)